MPASQTIFVYGTLKRGECREKCWPCAPRSVQPAFVRGRLLCLGSFPGLIGGDQWVRGEAWEIALHDFAETIRILDQIEGFQQSQRPNLYERIETDLFARIGGPGIGRAITYRLADSNLRQRGRIVKATSTDSGEAYAEWSAAET